METMKEENQKWKSKITALEKQINIQEQYQRRQCLRIDGIECSSGTENVEKIVSDLMKDVDMTVSPLDIDRAHRIGPVYSSEGKRFQSIIVKFVSFGTRTKFYRKRKEVNGVSRIRVDLTKSNYNLLKKINELINERQLRKNVYAFADINCRIKVVDKSIDESLFVECLDDFESFLSQT